MRVKGFITQCVQQQARPPNSRHSPAFTSVSLPQPSPLFQLCHVCCLPSHSKQNQATVAQKRLFFHTRFLFSHLRFNDQVDYTAYKCAANRGRAAIWEKGGRGRLKPALAGVDTWKIACAPTLLCKGLKFQAEQFSETKFIFSSGWLKSLPFPFLSPHSEQEQSILVETLAERHSLMADTTDLGDGEKQVSPWRFSQD